MEVTINARHCKVPDSLKNQAEQRFARMERIDRRITTATLVFDEAAGVRRAEARLTIPGGSLLVGHGQGATLRAAMDGALGRLDRQLKRSRDRRVARRTRDHAATRVLATVGDYGENADDHGEELSAT
ncbi:MAG TPA: ribosome-associated translation inhibitor RaiA [Longimicrobiales bacterium]|nr:ribosome-associated translation inhibitor RaiA [Longimicrobiales bacterium]